MEDYNTTSGKSTLLTKNQLIFPRKKSEFSDSQLPSGFALQRLALLLAAYRITTRKKVGNRHRFKPPIII